MAWVLLVVAGLLEVGWAIGLKYTDGFTKPWPSIFTVVAMVISVVLLGTAMKSLPVGTSYAVWVGIGAVGTAAHSSSQRGRVYDRISYQALRWRLPLAPGACAAGA